MFLGYRWHRRGYFINATTGQKSHTTPFLELSAKHTITCFKLCFQHFPVISILYKLRMCVFKNIKPT